MIKFQKGDEKMKTPKPEKAPFELAYQIENFIIKSIFTICLVAGIIGCILYIKKC
jgi:hypothetical protein